MSRTIEVLDYSSYTPTNPHRLTNIKCPVKDTNPSSTDLTIELFLGQTGSESPFQ